MKSLTLEELCGKEIERESFTIFIFQVVRRRKTFSAYFYILHQKIICLSVSDVLV